MSIGEAGEAVWENTSGIDKALVLVAVVVFVGEVLGWWDPFGRPVLSLLIIALLVSILVGLGQLRADVRQIRGHLRENDEKGREW